MHVLSASFNQRQPWLLQLYYPSHLKTRLLIAPQHLLHRWLWGLKVEKHGLLFKRFSLVGTRNTDDKERVAVSWLDWVHVSP